MEVTHLQDGLFRLCKERMAEDKVWLENHEIPETMTYEIFDDYRFHQLRQALIRVYNNSSFYKELFDKNNISPEDFKTFKDLEKFPFTSPEDIRGNSYSLLCTSQSEVTKPVTFYSSGTTGIKKRIHFSQNDVANIIKFLGIGMNCVASTDEVCQVIMPNSLGRGIGSILATALNKIGYKAYATDIFASSKEQVEKSLENKATVWFGDAGTMYRITKECEKDYDLKNAGLKIIFPTIGNISDTMKAYFEKAWNCKVITHYGLTEMGWGLAVDCLENNAYHYNELDVYTECINPETGEVVPDGENGELVFTSLGRESMPLIRYRSHDFASLTHGGCKCGKECEIMGHIIKRVGGEMKTKAGKEIYPPLFEDTLFSNKDFVDYRISLKDNELIFEVELLADLEENAKKLKTQIESLDVLKDSGFNIIVKPLKSQSLKEFALEKKYIHKI